MSGMLKKLDPAVMIRKSDDEKSKEISTTEQWLFQMKLANPYHRVIGTYAHRLNTGKKSSNAPMSVTKWFIPFLIHRILRILPTCKSLSCSLFFSPLLLRIICISCKSLNFRSLLPAIVSHRLQYHVDNFVDGFVLRVLWKLAVTWGNGPFWPRWATFVAQCDKYAWTNMLFINNLVPWRQKFGETSECMYHAWYLGVDFQLCAVLTPIFVTLYLRRRCRRLAIVLELVLIALVISLTYINTFRRDWSGHLMDGKQTLQYDRDAYINPFYRAIPYIAGFITAQIWHEKSRICPHLGLCRWVRRLALI